MKDIRNTIILLLISSSVLFISNVKSNTKINSLQQEITELEFELMITEKIKSTCDIANLQTEFREVIFTNYYVNDSDGSSDMTASGLSSKHFTVDNGIYQYKGLDVLATANTSRWSRELKEGYDAHELYEIITYQLNGQIRKGIVLDVCGACMGWANEDLQRYDVYTTKSIFGKKKGYILNVERGE